MKSLTQFKKEMKEFYNIAVDAEEGETFSSWFSDLMNCLKSDKKVVKKGNRTYILD